VIVAATIVVAFFLCWHILLPPGVAGNEKQLVLDYLQKNLNDPTGLEIVEWDGPKAVLVRVPQSVGEQLVELADQNYTPHKRPEKPWKPGVYVYARYRAKNGFGARVLREQVFLIQNGSVVRTAAVDVGAGELGYARSYLGEMKDYNSP
jgi:hypothetical protein